MHTGFPYVQESVFIVLAAALLRLHKTLRCCMQAHHWSRKSDRMSVQDGAQLQSKGVRVSSISVYGFEGRGAGTHMALSHYTVHDLPTRLNAVFVHSIGHGMRAVYCTGT